MKKLLIAMMMTFSTSALAIPTGPVMVGGEADLDACGGWGITTATTTLFTKNSEGYMDFGIVAASTGVNFCDYHKDHDGEFYGIVYSVDGKTDCGVSSPIKDRKAYDGKCKSGWVKKEFLLMIAG